MRRCLEKRQEQRFSSARDLAFAIEALGEIPGAAREPAPPVRIFTARRLLASLSILGAIALALVWGRLAVDSEPAQA